jgi:hypothetical protein
MFMALNTGNCKYSPIIRGEIWLSGRLFLEKQQRPHYLTAVFDGGGGIQTPRYSSISLEDHHVKVMCSLRESQKQTRARARNLNFGPDGAVSRNSCNGGGNRKYPNERNK